YTINELSRILDLHPKTILRFIKEGKIQANKIGRTWRVTEDELKSFCHGELASNDILVLKPDYDTLNNRISISAVIEIKEQNSEEASRISNMFMAVLNSESDVKSRSRFDFFYYPEIEKAKYVFYGSADFVTKIIEMFNQLTNSEDKKNEKEHIQI
ncbi:MAG: helix-turn-helix domain-containing protein, partial [Clostridia bacterium]